MAGLRKGAGPDAYVVSRTLEGVRGPGRRTVRELDVRGLDGESVGGISVLPAFGDLEHLTLERVCGVDLGPLAGLGLVSLRLLEMTGVDLAPLGDVDGLEALTLMDVEGCAVPVPLPLPQSLRSLALNNDGPELSGEPIREIVEAIDWGRLRGLQSLSIGVGGLTEMEPIKLDLGFLRELASLEYLKLYRGVWHEGDEPSPLEPPFSGLSRRLHWVRIDAWEPERVKPALRDYLGLDPTSGKPSVFQREPFTPPAPEWSIDAPEQAGERWSAYGSFARHEGGGSEVTEHDAARRARARLRRVDARLARRVEFDPENAGTGILTRSREDLEAVLRILGVGGP